MFIIIGGDGKEYGPATSEQVRNWLKAGRANLDTRAKALGSDEWRRLGDYAEFNPPSDTPPVIDEDGATAAPDAAAASAAATPADPLIGAERGTRLVARLIDWGLETLCAVPGAVLLGGELIKLIVAASQGKEPEFDQLDLPKVILGASVLVVGWLALLAVQVWMLASRGQSIGKRIRPVFHLVDWCLIFRDDQRCLHDSLAGTRVVKA
jgi:uncharacterized RDD family membrane protein YckC